MDTYSFDDLIPIASQLIVQHFDLEEFSVKEEGGNLEEFQLELKRVIAYLLDKDFERLIRSLYRVDIDEEKLKYALSGIDKKEPVDLLVEYVTQRELAKAKTRLQYRNA